MPARKLLRIGNVGRAEAFYPEDPQSFFAMVDMDIGPTNVEGGDIVNVMVCTPCWFEENIMTRRPSNPTQETVRKDTFVGHYFFAHEFDEKEAGWIVNRVKGKGWSEFAPRLSRYFGWEFEDDNQDGGLSKSF